MFDRDLFYYLCKKYNVKLSDKHDSLIIEDVLLNQKPIKYNENEYYCYRCGGRLDLGKNEIFCHHCGEMQNWD